MSAILSDLRFAVRNLVKRPGASILGVIAFALGIGLCTTMFSIIYGVYLRGLGVPEADRLVVVHRANVSQEQNRMWVDQHDFYDWREQQRWFEGMAAYYDGTVNITDRDGPERLSGAFVTANVFDVLRVSPVVGSAFRQGDDRAGSPLTAVLGYDLWQTRYGGSRDVVGRTVRVNGEQATILGVMPDGFMFPEQQVIWVAQRDSRTNNPRRGSGNWSNVFGRLAAGVTEEQALQGMNVVQQHLAEAYPDTNKDLSVTFTTFVRESIGDEALPVFAAMQVATIFVLLIACANVANLLLARAALRSKDAALRSALGANRFRVAFPFFAEAAALSAIGASVGMVLAIVGLNLFDRVTVVVGRPYFMQFPLDLPILGFVLAVTVGTALVSGAAPSLQVLRSDVNKILKDEGRGTSSFRAGKLSKVLVVGQVALSCALLVGAGLMTKSIVNLRTSEYPFDTQNVFTARVALFETNYPSREARNRFYRDLRERLAALPRVQAASLTDRLPGDGGSVRVALEGQVYASDQDYPRVQVAATSLGLFETFGVDVLRGRDFAIEDDSAAPRVAIVNQRFAERFFAGEDPIGRRIREGGTESDAEWATIVGLVPNLRMEGIGSQSDSAGFYLALPQLNRSFVSIALNVAGGAPMSLTREVRDVVRGLDPDLPIYYVRDMNEVIYRRTWFYEVFGTLFIVFGVAALFLASVGLYGVLSFSVSRRIQEMGIRMAMGATTRDVIKLILREGALQVGVGLGIGLGLAVGVSRVANILLFDVEPRDPTVFATIVALIVIVALIASLVPARRATGVHPIVALRYE